MTKRSSELTFIVRFGISVLVASGGALLCFLPWGEAANHYFYDSLFRLRGNQLPSNQIVIVGIDDSSSDEIKLPWPWPREMHARLIESIFAAGARAVAFDILFDRETTEEQDAALASAIDRHDRVVLVSDIVASRELATDAGHSFDAQLGDLQTTVIEPAPIRDRLKVAPRIGYDKLEQGSDGFVRRVLLAHEEDRSFAVAAVEAYTDRSESIEHLRGGYRWVNFRGSSETFVTVPYWRALNPAELLPPNIFKNKLVFVGFSTLSPFDPQQRSADHFPVPFSRSRGGYMPGVEIHANIAQNLLEGTFITVHSRAFVLSAGLLLAIGAGLIFLTASPLTAVVFYTVCTAVSVGTIYLAFVQSLSFVSPFYLLTPLTASFLVSPFIHYWQTKKQKDFIRKAFSTYLAPALVEELIQNRDKLELGGEEQEGTVLFLDLANFTTLSEKLSPKELISFVNKNLGTLSQTILANDGMIDKYIGDCIMAVWGIPMYRPNHSWIACKALLEIFTQVQDLAANAHAASGQLLSVRAGLASGTMVAGNVGGGTQFNYTVLGNVVNLASRLEGINKFYSTSAIVSETVARQVQDKCVLRELDLIRVKGQDTPVAVFELCGYAEQLSTTQRNLYDCYAEALRLYRQRSFRAALEQFQMARTIKPDDGPTGILLSRCEEFISRPPPDTWDGVYRMTEK